MTISKSRGSTKKLGPVSIGNKIVRFKITNLDRRFTVHEDLICRTSRFFKARLQKNRKTLSSVDECCVCAEVLDPTVKDITFCIRCGQNVHEGCIETWKQSSMYRGHDKPQPTCPMCRASWKNEPLLRYLGVGRELDAEAVQAYLDWLYSGTLHIDETVSRKTDEFNLRLLKAWEVANAVGDDTFRNTVITTFFMEARARFWLPSVKWAFIETAPSEEIKQFVIDVFMAYMEPGWFKKEAAKWPDVFVRDLADLALEDMQGKKDFLELKRDWLKKLGKGIESTETTEADSDDEVVEQLTPSSDRSVFWKSAW